MAVMVYTDGACSGNPGPGGWGVRIENGDQVVERNGGEAETTNNRMELVAAIEALKALDAADIGDSPITLITDSVYVKDGITKWIADWKRRNWRTAARKPVKNADLWRVLDAAVARRAIDWQWVRGHTGHAGNERADELARDGMLPFMKTR